MAMRKTVFSQSDAYQWKTAPGLIPFTPFEEYKQKLEAVFRLRRDGGILEARLHTDGDSMVWSLLAHKAIHQFYTWVGQDHDNEVLIYGGSGRDFFRGISGDSEYEELDEEQAKGFEQYADNEADPEMAWLFYEHMYYDGTNEVEGQLWDLEIPTIGVWNGAATHSELFLLNDITLCTEDAWMVDMHFRANMVPADGVQIAWRELMGRKRFAYAELTGQIITARRALAYGMVNEIQPTLEDCYRRAWEIAELIMLSGTRVTRRITTQILRAPWKQDAAWELRHGFSTEMYCSATQNAEHDNSYFRSARQEAAMEMEAERQGKVVRPRCGPYVMEPEIK